MTKRTRKRHQKGGFWPFTSSTQSWGDYFSSWKNKASSATSTINDSIGNIASDIGSTANQYNPFNDSMNSNGVQNFNTSGEQNYNTGTNNVQDVGSQSLGTQNFSQQAGKRRRKHRKMSGGNAPVSGLKVAHPTTWLYYNNGTNQTTVKGGKRRTRRRRRTNKNR